jgi:4-alpha-glucanotransferase
VPKKYHHPKGGVLFHSQNREFIHIELKMDTRGSGLLLHITSLPSDFGIGDLGPGAYRFADFLAEAKQRYWQILPLNPTDLEHGCSPYHSISAFASNSLLISPEILVEEGWLFEDDLDSAPVFFAGRVDYPNVLSFKSALLNKAYERFKRSPANPGYEEFCFLSSYWLDDFALFAALKTHMEGKPWSEWPEELRDRDSGAVERISNKFYDEIERERFFQYLFFRQWTSLKGYCHQKGIKFIGDMPIYVVYDSADVWLHPMLFNLDNEKQPITVAGVPPDYFSETGQLWGNPVYRWEVHRETGFDWWIQRLKHNLRLFDFVRVDHFRGFMGYWEVPAKEENAMNGNWVAAPGEELLSTINRILPDAAIIAEDLGVITPDVTEIMDRFGFPGMKLLIFAFGNDLPTNPYAPHNVIRNCIVYTGTHDNNTIRGWFENEAPAEVKERFFRYIGTEVPAEEISMAFVRLAMMTVADTVIIPIQDLLRLGEEARMNRPATRNGNWEWRLDSQLLSPEVNRKLREMTELYGRG